MPRAHTREERAQIHRRLLDTGLDHFTRFGLAKTTVADLSRGAGIGKGSFYHFFDSKEELFLAIQDREEAQFKADLTAEIDAAASGREAVVALFGTVAARLERHPFLRALLDPATLQALTLRVPTERLERHREDDRAYFLALAQRWKERGWLRPEVDAEAMFDVLGAMFAISLQRELLGDASAERAMRELTLAVADRWCAD